MWSLEFVEVKEERNSTETRNRLKSASGSDVIDLTKLNATSSSAAAGGETKQNNGLKSDSAGGVLRSQRAPSEPVAPPRKKHAAAKRIPPYRGSPLDKHLLEAVDETSGDCPFDDVREKFRDPKASVAIDDDGDDLISFDDDAFDDDEDDDDAFATDVTETEASANEPSLDSCVDALESSSVSLAEMTQQDDGFEVVDPKGIVRAISREDHKNAALMALVGSAMTGARPRRKLRDGFRWQKQLVFRYKLTMHTAFERKDNKCPAAVTAVAMSRSYHSFSR